MGEDARVFEPDSSKNPAVRSFVRGEYAQGIPYCASIRVPISWLSSVASWTDVFSIRVDRSHRRPPGLCFEYPVCSWRSKRTRCITGRFDQVCEIVVRQGPRGFGGTVLVVSSGGEEEPTVSKFSAYRRYWKRLLKIGGLWVEKVKRLFPISYVLIIQTGVCVYGYGIV